jgi:hypothetical protein
VDVSDEEGKVRAVYYFPIGTQHSRSNVEAYVRQLVARIPYALGWPLAGDGERRGGRR